MTTGSGERFTHAGNNGYVHTYRKGDTVALYNALNQEIAFVAGVAQDADFDPATHLAPGDYSRFIDQGLDVARGWPEGGAYLADLQERAVQETIRTLYLIPTMVCNYRCKYCQFIQDFNDNRNVSTMSVVQARGLVDEFYEMSAGTAPGNRDLVFFGGEPFMAPEIVTAVMEYVRVERDDSELNLIAFTNASMVTDEIARTCARNRLYAIVSMDGPACVNDEARVDLMGRGSLHRTIEGYKRFKAAGCKVGISIMAGTHNVDSLRESVEWLLDELEPDEVGIAGTFHPLGDQPNPFQADPEAVVSAMVETYTACRDRGVYVDQVARRLRPFVAKRAKLKDCMACGGKTIATPKGMDGHCEYLAFRKQSQVIPLVQINGNQTADWVKRAPVLKRDCQNCPALGVCGGGCPYNAYQLHGSLDALDEENCNQTRALLSWMISDLHAQCATGDQARESNAVLLPSQADRDALFGKIDAHDDSLPMRTVSTHGE